MSHGEHRATIYHFAPVVGELVGVWMGAMWRTGAHFITQKPRESFIRLRRQKVVFSCQGAWGDFDLNLLFNTFQARRTTDNWAWSELLKYIHIVHIIIEMHMQEEEKDGWSNMHGHLRQDSTESPEYSTGYSV